MVDETRWVAKVHWQRSQNNNERYELDGDPSYIWDQCGYWLSDETVKSIELVRTTA